jgi:hypothetical protein
LALEPDLLPAGNTGWNFHVDVFAGWQMQALGGALRRVFQADRQRCFEVARRRRFLHEILWLELGRAPASTRPRSTAESAEHVTQNVLKAAAPRACAPAALESIGAECERLKIRPALRRAAGLRAKALEAAEARLALAIDLAIVEGFAFLVVAKNFVSRVQLGKARGCLRIVLVGVGVQFLGELAEGAFDLRFIRILAYPQNFIGVPHRLVAPICPSPERRLWASIWGNLGLMQRGLG